MKKIITILTLCISGILCAQTIGIVGPAANGWPDATNPTPDIMLTDNGNGVYSINGLTLNTGDAKFREDQQWNVSYGGDAFPNGTIIANGNNISVQAGVYDIVFDLTNNVYSFTSVSNFTDIELVGTAVSGTTNPLMSTTDGVIYNLESTKFLNGDLEFRELGTSTTYGASTFPSGTASTTSGPIPVVGSYYKVTFNLNTLVFSFDIPQIGIVGPAANGWPGATPTDIVMTTTDGDIYILSNQVLTTDELKFREDLAWDVNWGGTGFPAGTISLNGMNINVTAGTYDITFSREAGTFLFDDVLSNIDATENTFSIYPNPSNQVWIIENLGSTIENLIIYDQLGKVVFTSTPNSNTVELNVDGFETGLFIAKIEFSDSTHRTVKLIKK